MGGLPLTPPAFISQNDRTPPPEWGGGMGETPSPLRARLTPPDQN